MMKKANVLVVPNGATTMAVSCSPPGPTSSPKHAGPTPTILVSDAATITKGAGGSNNDGSRSPDRRKEKKEKIEKERIEKERRKMEKEQKKGKSDSKEGKLDRFRGSKITMEKFFKKKIKDREERKEKEKEERERESILAEEGSLGATDNGGGDDAANAKEEQPKDKEKKKKKEKKDKKDKDKKKAAAAADYYEASSGRDEDDGGDELKRKKKRKKASSSTSSSPSSTLDKDKDPMEREAEREDEREESQGGSSDDNSSSDTDDSEEEERRRGKNLLRPDGAGVDALRPQRRRKKDWTVSQEFRVLALETEEKQKPDFSFALQHKNRDKNRYGNALPNPETRVVLKGGDTDYINANYIQGEQTQYIAAQAPLPNTFGDFWLMVWEQNTRVIMMLTRLTENDRTKAEIYWPRKGPLGRARGSFSGDDGDSDGDGDDAAGWKQYGKMRVSLTKSTLLEDDEDVAIRHFRLRNDDEPDVERQVIQIHFTGWPDFGVPQSTKSFIQLLELMESFNKEPTITESSEPNGPIILHCSAGLGRTGTLIAAHIAAEKLKLKRLNSKEDIDMKAIVAQLREQRSGMVQTKCQYKFLHDLLNDL